MSEQEGGWGRLMRGGILWSNASFVATRAVSMLALLVLARLLTPSEFGVVAAVTVYVALIELGADLGMKATVVYEQEHGHTPRVQSAFTLNLIISAALTGIGVLLAPVIADFFRIGDEVGLFRLAALNPLIRGLGNIHDALLMRDMAFRRRSIPEFVMAAVRAATSIPLAALGFGAESIVIGLLAGSAAWTIVHWVLTPLRPNLSFDPAIVRTMIGYGGGASALSVISAVALRVDQAVIGRVLGERALGLYTIAFRLPELLIESIAWNVSRVAFPGLARQRVADEEGLTAAAARIVHFQSLYAVPLAVGIAVLGPPLVVVLFGPKWEPAGGVASAVAVTAGLSAVAFPLGDIFKAVGRQRVLVALNVIQLPIYVAAVILVAPAGIVAVAWTRAGIELVHTVLVGLTATRALAARMRIFLAAAGPSLVAGLGVLAGAGAVRLLWSDLALVPLLAGFIAGGAAGALSLRLLAPAAFAELGALVMQLRRTSRPEVPAAEGR